jgi:hypothetical protein
MKGIVAVIVFVLGYSVSYGQIAEPLYFKEKIHDFGDVLEQGGNSDYEFVYTNNSTRPVRIISVQASCGCTTPGWTKEAVIPGKTGFIKASFNPKGRPGYFNKSLTVTTDLGGNPIILQIKGNVVDKITTKKEEDLSVEKGSLRLRNSSFNLGKVFINQDPMIMEFPIVNGGKEKIDFSGVNAPSYIQVTTPNSLAPNEKSVLKIKYDAKARNAYGFQSDNIELKTNDTDPIKSFSVYATIEEYFPPLTSEEMLKSPIMSLSTMEIDFQRIKKEISIENKLTIQNRGKKNLEIRSIQSNCSCVLTSTDKQVLKPGESATLTIKFLTEGRVGTQNKAITVYSNDPKNPVQRVNITGYIED